MIRLIVAGFGAIGQRHADLIRAAHGASLAAIVEPAPGPAARAASMGVPVFAHLQEALAAGLADGVILATPNARHVPDALTAIAARLPVLIEKPIGTDLAETRKLVAAAEAAQVPVLVGHHRRHNPLVAAAHKAIAEGVLGRIVSAHVMFWVAKPDSYFAPEWRRQPGAGPILVNLIHDLDLMRHLLGEVIAVQAVQSAWARGHAVEDSAAVLFEFASGALGTASISDTIPAPWSWELTAAENPAYPASGQSCYQIGGTAAAMELPSGRIWRHDGPRSWTAPILASTAPRASGDPLQLQLAHFLSVIRGEAAPLVNAREGMRTLALLLAVKQAAKSGQRVPVADPGH